MKKALAICSARRRIVRAALRAIAGVTLAGCCLWAACAATGGAFQVTTNPGGGAILTGTLGNASLPGATAALMRRVHTELGTRPVVVQSVLDAHDHSVALLFTAARNGRPYTGVAIVTANPGAQAAGAALYDETARFHTTVDPLLRRLRGITEPAATSGAPIKFAPAEPLVTRPFDDGTGSIGVPAGWTLGANGGGGAQVSRARGGAQVSYNMHLMGLDPTSPRAQMLMRMQSAQARQNFPGVVLAYTSDPVAAWTSMYAAMGRKHGLPPPAFHITSSTRVGASAANIAGTLGTGPKATHFVGFVSSCPRTRMGFGKSRIATRS